MMKILVVALLLFSSCQKEQKTEYTASIKNSSTHIISILFYRDGLVGNLDSIQLSSNELVLIANGTFRGLVDIPSFSSSYFGSPQDSIIVIFDHRYRMSHYSVKPNVFSIKHHFRESPRNLGNPNSYDFESKLIGGRFRSNTHFYTFTDQDFLDASL